MRDPHKYDWFPSPDPEWRPAFGGRGRLWAYVKRVVVQWWLA